MGGGEERGRGDGKRERRGGGGWGSSIAFFGCWTSCCPCQPRKPAHHAVLFPHTTTPFLYLLSFLDRRPDGRQECSHAGLPQRWLTLSKSLHNGEFAPLLRYLCLVFVSVSVCVRRGPVCWFPSPLPSVAMMPALPLFFIIPAASALPRPSTPSSYLRVSFEWWILCSLRRPTRRCASSL